ncbi:MAG: methyltransferase domain-containing protein [Gammaproteobacteria bacterium]
MTDRRAEQERWNRYWEHGFVTSCSGAFTGNYEGTLRTAWEDFFGELPAGARVLDICTGNGAIAMIANQVSRAGALNFEIDAIDSAIIRPMETVKERRDLLDGIRFHSQTAAESTPFPDRVFDAISGQYAFEYTDEAGCINEMARIAARGCRVQLIIHHERSVVIETSTEELRNGDLIFSETRVFDAAEAMIQLVGNARSAAEKQALARNPEAEVIRNRLNQAAASLGQAAQSSAHPELLQMALDRIAGAYRAVGENLETALARLETGRQEIQANLARLQDLMAASRSPEDIRRITQALAHAGFESPDAEEFRHNGGPLMGWKVQTQLL